MAKVTSKLQVTIPKAIADEYGITPGIELDWIPSGDAIRVVPASSRTDAEEVKRRLRSFDEATERQAARERAAGKRKTAKGRGWKREAELSLAVLQTDLEARDGAHQNRPRAVDPRAGCLGEVAVTLDQPK